MIHAFVDGSQRNDIAIWSVVIQENRHNRDKLTYLSDYFKAGKNGAFIAEYAALDNCLRYMKSMGIYTFVLHYDLDDFERVIRGRYKAKGSFADKLREKIVSYGVQPILKSVAGKNDSKNYAHRYCRIAYRNLQKQNII